jgi:hypothetical protein
MWELRLFPCSADLCTTAATRPILLLVDSNDLSALSEKQALEREGLVSGPASRRLPAPDGAESVSALGDR